MTGQQTDQQTDQQTEQPRLELLPAVDIAGGQAVQLVQGVAGSGGSFGDPWEAALRWQERGPSGSTSSTSTPPSGAAATASSSPRSSAGSTCRSSSRAASATPTRSRRRSRPAAAASTSAPRPSRTRTWTASIIAEHGDRVAIGLDVRGTTLAARGWTREGGDLWETLERLDAEGCARYVVTDVNKDGMLQGPNVAAAPRRVRAHRPSRRRERRRLDPRGHRHDPRARRRGGRGSHRRVGPLPRRVHPARGPRRRRRPAHEPVATARDVTTTRPGLRRPGRGRASRSPRTASRATRRAPTPALLAALAAAHDAPGADDARRALMERVAAGPLARAGRRRRRRGRRLRAARRRHPQRHGRRHPDLARRLAGPAVFTSLESLAAWDADGPARAGPAAAAAQAAISEECHVLVVDVASPHATVLRPSMLWALAQERPWVAEPPRRPRRGGGARCRRRPSRR